MSLNRKQFEEVVGETIDNLDPKFKQKLHNVAILVQERPTREQIKKTNLGKGYLLFGLFEGYVQSRRLNFGAVLPDRITLFREHILEACRSEEECREKIKSTLKHEIAHHFGSDEKGACQASRT